MTDWSSPAVQQHWMSLNNHLLYEAQSTQKRHSIADNNFCFFFSFFSPQRKKDSPSWFLLPVLWQTAAWTPAGPSRRKSSSSCNTSFHTTHSPSTVNSGEVCGLCSASCLRRVDTKSNQEQSLYVNPLQWNNFRSNLVKICSNWTCFVFQMIRFLEYFRQNL